MHIVSVIPLKKTILTEPLTYFTKQKVSLGQIVVVPIRKQQVNSVVVKIDTPEKEKADLKSSSFSLKKISTITSKFLCFPDFIKALEKENDYYAYFMPRTLRHLYSQKIIDNIDSIKSHRKDFDPTPIHDKTIISARYAIQAEDYDRYSEYKNIIRETLARKQSALVIVPTHADLDNVSTHLKRGIDKHTFILDTRKTKTHQAKVWNEVVHKDDAQLIITTGTFLGIPKDNLGAIIIERESSAAYKTIEKPYIDIRHFAQTYCSISRIPMYVGDTLLRTETIHSVKQGNYTERRPLVFRVLSPAKQTLVMMHEEKDPVSPFLSKEAIGIISDAQENNEHVFIFAARKGLAPTVVCDDCGKLTLCSNCSSPMTLYSAKNDKDKNTLRCHHCGQSETAGIKCDNCGSWKLRMLGVGTESIASNISELFPNSQTFIVDSTHTKTPKQVKDTIAKFQSTPGGILIGTELAIANITNPIHNTIISSIDALFSLPDYRIRERIMQTLLAARQRTHQNFLIQTRNEFETLFSHIIGGNLSAFYKEEIESRKQFGYPPFMKLIKITRSGDKREISSEMKQLVKFFEPQTLHVYPAFTEKINNAFVLNGLIRILPENWPDKELLEKLRMLPPSYRVEVDAQHVL